MISSLNRMSFLMLEECVIQDSFPLCPKIFPDSFSFPQRQEILTSKGERIRIPCEVPGIQSLVRGSLRPVPKTQPPSLGLRQQSSSLIFLQQLMSSIPPILLSPLETFQVSFLLNSDDSFSKHSPSYLCGPACSSWSPASLLFLVSFASFFYSSLQPLKVELQALASPRFILSRSDLISPVVPVTIWMSADLSIALAELQPTQPT